MHFNRPADHFTQHGGGGRDVPSSRGCSGLCARSPVEIPAWPATTLTLAAPPCQTGLATYSPRWPHRRRDHPGLPPVPGPASMSFQAKIALTARPLAQGCWARRPAAPRQVRQPGRKDRVFGPHPGPWGVLEGKTTGRRRMHEAQAAGGPACLAESGVARDSAAIPRISRNPRTLMTGPALLAGPAPAAGPAAPQEPPRLP